MRISLIITTYNRPDALLLVLKSVENQSISPLEVIIADDGSSHETKNLIESINKSLKMNIVHSWHKDLGFRAARARNNAILKSSGEYIVLIDGDSILHPNFVEDHIESSEPGCFIQGSRVLLSQHETKKILKKNSLIFPFFSANLFNRKNSIHSKLLSKIFSRKK